MSVLPRQLPNSKPRDVNEEKVSSWITVLGNLFFYIAYTSSRRTVICVGVYIISPTGGRRWRRLFHRNRREMRALGTLDGACPH